MNRRVSTRAADIITADHARCLSKVSIWKSATADGVQEYCVIDLNNRTIYVHRSPSGGTCTTQQVLAAGAHLNAELAPTVSFAVDELLG